MKEYSLNLIPTDACKNKGRILPRMINELRYAFEVEFPKCEGEHHGFLREKQQLMSSSIDEWVAIQPYKIILRLVARSSTRVFLGETVCRNEEFLDAMTSYSLNLFKTVALLRPFPEFSRPLVAKLLPSYRTLRRQLNFAQGIFMPILQQRRAAESAGDAGYEKPDDFLQWMLDLVDNEKDANPRFFAHHFLQLLGLAVSHTSTMAMTHIIYDLAMMPEYLELLRNEIREALPDGWENASQSALHKLKRLDSFMKESQRCNPPGHRK